jgi:hypothetical protein
MADVFCEEVNFHPCSTENAAGKRKIFKYASELVGRWEPRHKSFQEINRPDREKG